MRSLRLRQGIPGLIGVLAVGLISTSANAKYGMNASTVKSEVPSVITTIEPSYTYSGVAHVANGASLRNAGSATIRLRGMPADAYVIKAFLYWDFASVTTPTYAQSNVIFSRQFNLVNSIAKVYGTQIGTGADPCWFGDSNFAYRADVTKWVRGNGDYVVTLLPGASSSTNGADPWGPSAPTSGPLAEGASIVAIYTSSLEPTGTVLLYDSGLAGTEFDGTLSYDLDQVPTPPGVSTSIFTELGADGQVGGSDIGLSLTPEITLKTTQLNLTLIAGPGSAVNDADWNGDDGIPLNQLWDTHSHDVTGLLTPGLNNITTYSDDDCIVTIANVLTVR
jgi:hypothetical protein